MVVVCMDVSFGGMHGGGDPDASFSCGVHDVGVQCASFSGTPHGGGDHGVDPHCDGDIGASDDGAEENYLRLPCMIVFFVFQ
jgi:hypothetical protein